MVNKQSRKTIRNILRKQFGNDKLGSKFRQFQENKYGFKEYLIMQRYNSKRKPNEKTLRQRGVVL